MLSCFSFPKKPNIKEKWIDATGKGPDWFPVKRSVLCSEHFEEKCFQLLDKSRRLFDWAVPTLKICRITSSKPVESPDDSDDCDDPLDLNNKPRKTLTPGSTCVTCGHKIGPVNQIIEIKTEKEDTASTENTELTSTQHVGLSEMETENPVNLNIEIKVEEGDNDSIASTSEDIDFIAFTTQPVMMMSTQPIQPIETRLPAASNDLFKKSLKIKMEKRISKCESMLKQRKTQIRTIQKRNCRYKARINKLEDKLKEANAKNCVLAAHLEVLRGRAGKKSD